MGMIFGVGDEVVQFLIVALLMMVAVLAWLSTNARSDRYRTVLSMRSRAHRPVTVSIRTRQVVRTLPRNSLPQASTLQVTARVNQSQARTNDPNQNDGRVIPLQEMDSIEDADMAMLDNNRLHFYRRMEAPQRAQVSDRTSSIRNLFHASDAEDEQITEEQIREMNRIVRAMAAEITDTSDDDSFRAETETASATPNEPSAIDNKEDKDKPSNENADTNNSSDSPHNPAEPDNRPKILIRLKYLNDTLKEVDGCLDELLKDFKMRHFSAELGAEQCVRLIFNGRVLLDEAATLRACGLHHRAVVHCLVQPRRASPARAARPARAPRGSRAARGPRPHRTGAYFARAARMAFGEPHSSDETDVDFDFDATHELVTNNVRAERSWDLENILMTLVSIGLTVVWFFRCEYANMFTASASVALFGLTAFYSVAIFGLYLSDTFHIERRPVAQPVPTN